MIFNRSSVKQQFVIHNSVFDIRYWFLKYQIMNSECRISNKNITTTY